MQNACFLFRDRASICQVNQQQQAQRERKKREKQAPELSHSLRLPSTICETNKQTNQKQQWHFYSLGISSWCTGERGKQTAVWVIEWFAWWPLEIIRLGVLRQGRLWGRLRHDTSVTVSHLKGHDPGQTPSLSVFLILKSMAGCSVTAPNKGRRGFTKHNRLNGT